MALKSVPYLTVGFGTRPQKLRTAVDGKPYKAPKPPTMPKPPTPKVTVAPRPNAPAARSKEIPLGRAGPGRPPSNLGQYLIKPVDDQNTGFEMLNSEPKIIGQVNQQYMRKGQLPPSLQPKYLRKPEVMEKGRAAAISKGFRKPRSHQG